MWISDRTSSVRVGASAASDVYEGQPLVNLPVGDVLTEGLGETKDYGNIF